MPELADLEAKLTFLNKRLPGLRIEDVQLPVALHDREELLLFQRVDLVEDCHLPAGVLAAAAQHLASGKRAAGGASESGGGKKTAAGAKSSAGQSRRGETGSGRAR